MRVVYTTEALADLDGIFDFIANQLPRYFRSVRKSASRGIARIARWPESAQEVSDRPGVRVAPLVRYPYKVFYQISGNGIEIPHIHHAARE